MNHKKVSLSDIAIALGISKSTVSFVLNEKGDQYNISKETQRLILEKAEELNFVPNFFAKTLREGKTKTIGLLVPDISNVFYGELSKNIQEELYKNGYNLFIVNTDDKKDFELKLFKDLLSRSIDGLIIAACNPIDNLKGILTRTHIPVVFVDRYGDNLADFIGINNYSESYNLVKKFSKKPKSLGVFYFQEDSITTIQLRINGITDVCKKENIEIELINLQQEKDLETKIKNLKAKNLDSIIALNNKVALQVISALNKNKMNIPKDVRFISFDDSEAFQYVNPPISALKQPIVEIGKEAAQQLLRRLKEEQIPGKCVEFSCTFIERSSN
jgi:LacI family transcriptional regulator